MDAVREQDVEVALGHVRAGVADLVRAPAARQRALDLAGRAGVDADALRGAGRAEPAEDLEDLGAWVRLEREPDDGTGARSGRALPGARGRSRRTGSGRRRSSGVPCSRASASASSTDDPQPAVRDVETGPDPPGRGGHAPSCACGCGCVWLASLRPLRSRPRLAASSGRDRPRRRRRPPPSSRADAAAISAIAPSNASALRRRRLRIAADLADVLAGGGLQFARRRRLIGATQGLDASAHARTVRHPAILGHDGSGRT